MSKLSLPDKAKRMVVALVCSLMFHVLLLTALLVLWPTSQQKRQAFQVWLSEPDKKTADLHADKPVVENQSTAISIRPKNAKFFAEQDHQAAQDLSQQEKYQKSATTAKKNIHKKSLTYGSQPVKLSSAKGKKTLDDPLGLKPQFSDDAIPTDASSPDYHPQVSAGDHNDLNTWQWRHAPFFNRIKSRIGQTWSPQAQISRFDPRGEQLGQSDRVTVLSIAIDQSGNLVEVLVHRASGVAYLDEEALRAVKAATPFLHPPKELFGDEAQFSFLFAFNLYLNRGFSLNFDW